jgi:hypothetical protein
MSASRHESQLTSSAFSGHQPGSYRQGATFGSGGREYLPEFLEASWRTGIVRYDVDLDARTVAYQGCNGEEYIEAYPTVTVA